MSPDIPVLIFSTDPDLRDHAPVPLQIDESLRFVHDLTAILF